MSAPVAGADAVSVPNHAPLVALDVRGDCTSALLSELSLAIDCSVMLVGAFVHATFPVLEKYIAIGNSPACAAVTLPYDQPVVAECAAMKPAPGGFALVAPLMSTTVTAIAAAIDDVNVHDAASPLTTCRYHSDGCPSPAENEALPALVMPLGPAIVGLAALDHTPKMRRSPTAGAVESAAVTLVVCAPSGPVMED